MKRDKQPIDLRVVNTSSILATSKVTNFRVRLQNYESDSNNQARMIKHWCKPCFYLSSGVSLQAFTTRECGLCGANQVYNSSDTDVICKDCAEEHNLCAHCGADIDLNPRQTL